MVDVDKLRGKIVEKRMNVAILSERIGMDRATMYRKLNCKGESFTLKEADSIVRELELTADEGVAIFFSQFVAHVRVEPRIPEGSANKEAG